MKSSELLRAAKALLRGPDEITGEIYLCFALKKAFINNPGNFRKHEEIAGRIADALFPHATVSGWLIIAAGVSANLTTLSNMQEYRHRWIDHLIQEYESKGD